MATFNDPRIRVLLDLYDLHTDYFRRAIEGISRDDAHNRLGTDANHVAWIAGSTVASRFEGARNLGVTLNQQSGELFANHRGIQPDATYPAPEEFLQDWNAISPLFREKLAAATTEWLDEQFDMEGWKATYYELTRFMTYREANMIGQIALWRRLLGYPAINYM